MSLLLHVVVWTEDLIFKGRLLENYYSSGKLLGKFALNSVDLSSQCYVLMSQMEKDESRYTPQFWRTIFHNEVQWLIIITWTKFGDLILAEGCMLHSKATLALLNFPLYLQAFVLLSQSHAGLTTICNEDWFSRRRLFFCQLCTIAFHLSLFFK